MRTNRNDIIYPELSYDIMGAAIRVHRELGPGLLERIYHAALEVELEELGISFRSHVPITVTYRGRSLGFGYEADLVVEDKIVVELKAVEQLLKVHEAQTLSYMSQLDCRVGLLLNFNVTNLMKFGYKRLVR